MTARPLHTPGLVVREPYDPAARYLIVQRDGDDDKSSRWTDGDDRQRVSYLLAAAPDLLAACEMASACADNGAWDAQSTEGLDRAARAVFAVRAAIRKARGTE